MAYLFLLLLKSGKSHVEALTDVILTKKLYGPLKHFPPESDVAVFLFKVSVLDPVLHFGMDHHECSAVKERNYIFYVTAVQSQMRNYIIKHDLNAFIYLHIFQGKCICKALFIIHTVSKQLYRNS